MDNQESDQNSVTLDLPLSKENEQKPENKVEIELNPELAGLHKEYNSLRRKLNQYSRILLTSGEPQFCSVDGLQSGLPLERDENGILKDQGEPVPNDQVVQKFGQDYHSESVIPSYYTWHMGDGSVVRYVIDFVLYTGRGDKFVPLDHLGRYESKIIMYCKVKHIGSVHTAEEIIENEHPWMETFKYRKKLDHFDGILKVPRKQRFFSSKVVIVDWYFDVGLSEEVPPYIWVVSENDVYYRIDRPSGGYYNTFVSTKLLFDMSTRVVKEMQSGRDKSFKEVIASMTKPSKLYNPNVFNPYNVPKVINRTEPQNPNVQPFYQAYDYDIDNEEMTSWGAPVIIHGSSMGDICRNLDFIVNECRYYYTMFGHQNVERYLTEMLDILKGYNPFHYFDKNFIKLEFIKMNELATKYKEFLFLDPNECYDYNSIYKYVRAQKRDKKLSKNKRFDLELYNNQYKKGDIKSRSGRIIRNKAVSEVETIIRKQVVQTESQKREEYRKAVELEAKCDGLLLPFNFEWSNYNTCSEASDIESTPILCNDADIELNNAKYYPRDIPLRTLKFYGVDELVDILDITRQFSVQSIGEQPLLPRVTFVQLEANLLYNSSLNEYKPIEMSSFEVASPLCLCNNKRFNNIHYWVGTSSLSHYLDGIDVNGPMEKNRDKCLAPVDDEEFEDGLQWIYYLNKNLVDEYDIDYPEDLDEGSIGKLYTGLLQEFRRSIYNSGFDLFIKNLKDAGEISDKKREMQERELIIAISDADLAHEFISTNGGCLYRGRFKRYGQEDGSVLPYVNGFRWNRRFKKFQRVVSVSSTYRYSTVSHDQDDDSFTVYDSRRPQNCPLDLLYGSESIFKSVSSPGDLLPTYKAVLNVWKKENTQLKKSPNMLSNSVNRFVSYLNRFSQGYVYSKKCLARGMDIGLLDHEYFKDYLVDGTEDYNIEPVLGYGFKEVDTLARNELLLSPDMISEYTWNTLLKIYLFYALYSYKAVYRFKLNSVVWGERALVHKQNEFLDYENENQQKINDNNDGNNKSEFNYDEEMIDTENLNMLDDMPYDDFSNSGAEEEEQSCKEEDEMDRLDNMELDKIDEVEDEDGEDKGEKEHLARRGWGLNRYCPYYEFEMEWYPDQEKFENLSKGKVNLTFIKSAFVKLKQKSFLQLDVYERLNLLLWLGDILTYSITGRNYIEKRNEEFYHLRTQLLKSEEDKKGMKRVKGTNRELQELEERYRQKPVLLGHDRFYNSYYYFGMDYDRRIYVHTMPQLRFVQNRIARRMRYIKVPTFKSCSFNLNLFEFAQKFTQDRIFNQPKGKRGRKRDPSKINKNDIEINEKNNRKRKRTKKDENEQEEDEIKKEEMELDKDNKEVKKENEENKEELNRLKQENRVNEQEQNKEYKEEMELYKDNKEVKQENNKDKDYYNNININKFNLVAKGELSNEGLGDRMNSFNVLKGNNVDSNDNKENNLMNDNNQNNNKDYSKNVKEIKEQDNSNKETYHYVTNDNSESTPNSNKVDVLVKRLETSQTPSGSDTMGQNSENPSSSGTPNHEIIYNNNKEEEGVRKKRGKGRTRNRPKVRRSRTVFDRHPTNFKTMEEYLEYLTNSTARMSWCVIDSHKSLKRFISRLSHFTTNERNLAGKFIQIEPDFTLPTFEIITYKCPTVAGEMLLGLLRGIYRYFKNEFSRMVLTTVIFNNNNGHLLNSSFHGSVDQDFLTNPNNESNKYMEYNYYSEDKQEYKQYKEENYNNTDNKNKDNHNNNNRFYDKLYKSYNNGLFLNFLVSDIIKKCLTLCVSDTDGCKNGLKHILELIYFFEFVANRFYKYHKWQEMRNEWKMNLENLYSQLVTDFMNTRKTNSPRVMAKVVGDHSSNCFVNNNNSGSPTNSGTCFISTPSGTADLIVLIEKAGLWFRFFEVYVRDPEYEFGLETYVNYRKVMDKYNNKLGNTDEGYESSQNQEGFRGTVDLLDFKEFRFDKLEIFEFFNEMKFTDTLVYYSRAMKEALESFNEFYKKLQDLLGIKVVNEKDLVAEKSTSKPKRKRKKKDKDTESDCNVTDLDSNFDLGDMYQMTVSQDQNEIKDGELVDESDQDSKVDNNSTMELDNNSNNEDMNGLKTEDNKVNVKNEEMKEVDNKENQDLSPNNKKQENNKEKEENKEENVKKEQDNNTENNTDKTEQEDIEDQQDSQEVKEEENKDKEMELDKDKDNKAKKRKKKDKNDNQTLPVESDEENKKDKKTKKTKRSKTTKLNSPKEEKEVGDEDESANELESGQDKDDNKDKKEEEKKDIDNNNEELIEDVKLLLNRLENMYENAPKETCEVNVLSLTTNLIHIKLPSNTEGSVIDDGVDKEDKDNEVEPDLLILCINLNVKSLECNEDSDGEDEKLDKKLKLLPNLRRLSRTMSKVERTRATKKVNDEPGYMLRTNEAIESKEFKLTIPLILKSPFVIDVPQYLYTYEKVFEGLSRSWRSSMKCVNTETGQQGVVKRANYSSQDVWKCIGVEWNDNKKEIVMLNPWEITT